jgi:formate dehydrogenase major subunit
MFDEIARVSAIHAGMSYDRLDDGPLAWPCLTADDPGAEVLFTDGAAFNLPPLDPPVAGNSPAGYPLLLGLTSSFQHFATGTQTRLVRQYAHFQSEDRVELHPDDAAAAGIADGALATVTTPHGVARLRARVTPEQRVGTAAVTINFPESGVGSLFGPDRDPGAKSPVFKAVPARVSPV